MASPGGKASQRACEIIEEAAAEAGLIKADTIRLVKVGPATPVPSARSFAHAMCVLSCLHVNPGTNGSQDLAGDGKKVSISLDAEHVQVMGPFLDALMGELAEGEAQRDALEATSQDLR